MQRSQSIFIVFVICIFIAFGVFIFSGFFTKIFSPIFYIMSPLQKFTISKLKNKTPTDQISKLVLENQDLQNKLAGLNIIEKENQALKDQFTSVIIASKNLLPADIIGMPEFIPGVNFPDTIVVDKGNKDGVSSDNAIVYKDSFIGSILKSTDHFSKASFVTSKNVSFTARALKTNAVGIVKGMGNGQMIFDNVLLSDNLEVGDFIVTTGDTSLNGKGYPPNLIVGKIVTVEKNPSNLFQKANIVSLYDFSHFSTVFIFTGK